MPDLRQQLQDLFGLDDFRPAQQEVIEDVLMGKDVLCVMPTGAGKSLCYQLPAIVGRGLSIVVSPLISLMRDQVEQLREQGINAEFLNSSQNASQQRDAIAQIEDSFEGLLYVAPERFSATTFQPLLAKLKVKLLAIDEAHCLSHWGHDFRPEYSQLGAVREKLGNPPTIALTATATEDVREDIIRGLKLRDPTIVITGFDRPNLRYECLRISRAKEKQTALLDLLHDIQGSAIVYCATRKSVDELTSFLAEEIKNRPVIAYHAGMDQRSRARSQEQFMQTARSIAVATNAFGMGINKPDVRLVVHYNLPGTLEAYYQEAGRAGRDGLPARCVLLYSYQDRMIQKFFIDKIGEERGDDYELIAALKARANDKLELMVQYAQSHRCRREQILDYFGDEAEIENCNCDICVHDQAPGRALPAAELPDEVVTLTRQILSAIARLNGRFGVTVIAETLAGLVNDRALRWGFTDLTVFGLLKQYPVKKLVAMVHRVMESGLVQQKNVGEDKPIHVIELTAAGVAVMKGQQLPPVSLLDLIPRRDGWQASGPNPRAMGTSPRARWDDDDQLDPIVIERFDRLRSVRMELAKARQLPPYCICHDSTLKLIAKLRPDTLGRLEQIKGMGPYKVKMYGEQLLSAIHGGSGSSL
ncbi:MAG TPA: ATP-dependent DNA helicase RecQ [Tepidisphaeraceae bacterium]|nr:ATP-dependent DNA helicase RecQ [Tepidisphaeraceae bacterium]